MGIAAVCDSVRALDERLRLTGALRVSLPQLLSRSLSFLLALLVDTDPRRLAKMRKRGGADSSSYHYNLAPTYHEVLQSEEAVDKPGFVDSSVCSEAWAVT